MSTIHVQSQEKNGDVVHLIREAISSEIARLELAREPAAKRLRPYEQRYGVDSAQFFSLTTAEDLVGGDEEYVSWSGEYQLLQRLEEKLQQLRDVRMANLNMPFS